MYTKLHPCCNVQCGYRDFLLWLCTVTFSLSAVNLYPVYNYEFASSLSLLGVFRAYLYTLRTNIDIVCSLVSSCLGSA